MTASGVVKSTATSAFASVSASRRSRTVRPAPSRSTKSDSGRPAFRRPTAATSSSSGSAAIAAQTTRPILPVAPTTPTRIVTTPGLLEEPGQRKGVAGRVVQAQVHEATRHVLEVRLADTDALVRQALRDDAEREDLIHEVGLELLADGEAVRLRRREPLLPEGDLVL